MSLDDIFGPYPGRPNHPDFRKLVHVVLQHDGKTEDADFSFPKYIGATIDTDSLLHMAKERCRRYAEQLGALPDDLPVFPIYMAAWLDAFMLGVEYEQAKGTIG